MSAAYRPYRDEEASDGQDNERLNWSGSEGHEPRSLQIYEKTTEDLPSFVNSRKQFLYTLLSVILISVVLGFIMGYFSHTHSDCVPVVSVALHSVRDEDPRIRPRILEMIDADAIKVGVEEFSREPRVPGSKYDLRMVQKVADFFRSHNLDRVEIKNYSVLLSLPDELQPNYVEVIESNHPSEHRVIFSSLNPLNNTKNHPVDSSFHAYSAYSPAGDVAGDVVFVNYGQSSDYHQLKEYNISLNGKILIAKQLNIAADEQVLLAQEAGAAALLLYPDPADTGSNIPDDAVRRDSLIWNGMGDPQTPGYPSTEHAFRIPIADLKILPKIPVQPISLTSALNILVVLGGRRAPEKWFPPNASIIYHLGPGFKNDKSYKVRVKVNNQLVNREIHNVIGRIRGGVEPDRYVLVGNHRDSWVNGAIDSASGSSALLQLVKVFGSLLSTGWRPRRTILFCSWGSEELNLMGSTEWLEENIKSINSRAVAYINVDILAVGNETVSVASSPLLYQTVFNATKRVAYPHVNIQSDPNPPTTVYDKWLSTFPMIRNLSQLIFSGSSSSKSHASTHHEILYDFEAQLNEKSGHTQTGHYSLLNEYVNSATAQIRPRIRPLDMRSVYASFFTLAGVPALEITFVPSAKDTESTVSTYPLIHTQYDRMDLIEKFDKDFRCHEAVTKILAEVIRDLSDSLFLPFNLLDYAQVLKDLYLSLQIHASSVFSSNGLNFDGLESAIKNFTSAALKFHSAQDKLDMRDPMAIRRVNDQLLLLERAFLDPNGLPRNPNKKHVVLSPSETSSSPFYDEMFPGLMDEFSILIHTEYENHSWSWDIIKAHFSILVYTIQSAADIISSEL